MYIYIIHDYMNSHHIYIYFFFVILKSEILIYN